MKKLNNKKYVFLGDIDSINVEIVCKSFNFLKYKIKYLVICNKRELLNDYVFKKKNIDICEIYDAINFTGYKKNKLNIFNIENVSKHKYLNLLNQIQIANKLANNSKYDLITMPINKVIFKKKIKFIGLTEYFGFINKKSTIMLMYGEKFSIIPLTTHVNLKKVNKIFRSNSIDNSIKIILINIKRELYKLNFNQIYILCYNPHCGEEGTLGDEDNIIKKSIKKYRTIKGPFPADSAFNKIRNNTLFISMYHDQALIPFKILNKESFNLTLGLNFRRLSPAHGTAKDIRNKNLASNKSYLKCLLF